jgi:hypothetical protein
MAVKKGSVVVYLRVIVRVLFLSLVFKKWPLRVISITFPSYLRVEANNKELSKSCILSIATCYKFLNHSSIVMLYMTLFLLFKSGVRFQSYCNLPKSGGLLTTLKLDNTFLTCFIRCISAPRALFDFIQRLLWLSMVPGTKTHHTWHLPRTHFIIKLYHAFLGIALLLDEASISINIPTPYRAPSSQTFKPYLVDLYFQVGSNNILA